MKRRAFTILLFLLLGAIVNVAVAWWITAAVDIEGTTVSSVMREGQWPRSVPDHWPESAHSPELRTFGWTLIQYIAWREEDNGGNKFFPTERFYIQIVKVGWPLRSVQYETWFDSVLPAGAGDTGYRPLDGQPQPTYWSRGVPFKFDRFGFEPRYHKGLPKRLPVQPVFPGFAINTLSYAIILWFLYYTPFIIRRHIRLKRGRCPKCGYDLRGKHDAGCPECGWNREEATA